MQMTGVQSSHTNASAAMFRISVPRPHRAQKPRSVSAPDRYFETLIGPIGDGWQLTLPITLMVERDEDGNFLVSESVTTVYGYAASGPEAINDYLRSLTEYFDIVIEAKTPESSDLGATLKRYLTRT